MHDAFSRSFGLIIAFILPGLVGLVAVGIYHPLVASWLSTAPTTEPTVGGFLYVVLGSLAVGLTISAIRWAVIDTLHHSTGLKPPVFDFAQLQRNLEAFTVAVEHYYRYYQFYANMVVAISGLAICHQVASGWWNWREYGLLIALEAILLAASRSSLTRYYSRCGQLHIPREKAAP